MTKKDMPILELMPRVIEAPSEVQNISQVTTPHLELQSEPEVYADQASQKVFCKSRKPNHSRARNVSKVFSCASGKKENIVASKMSSKKNSNGWGSALKIDKQAYSTQPSRSVMRSPPKNKENRKSSKTMTTPKYSRATRIAKRPKLTESAAERPASGNLIKGIPFADTTKFVQNSPLKVKQPKVVEFEHENLKTQETAITSPIEEEEDVEISHQ